jgi:translocator protein
MRSHRLGLFFWILVSLAAGWTGSIFKPGAWYESLTKPAWTPPNAVFGPVWTALYVLMGIAAWFAWRPRGFAGARIGLGLFITQLVLNTLWSFLFFGIHHPGLAYMDIVLLWFVVLGTMAAFWRVSKWAGALLLPYLAWITFASALNLQIWRLNG